MSKAVGITKDKLLPTRFATPNVVAERTNRAADNKKWGRHILQVPASPKGEVLRVTNQANINAP